MNRRDFFKMSALAGVTATLTGTAKAISLPDPAVPAKLRLSCQEGLAPGKTLAEKLDFMEGLGFEGLEIGGGDLGKRVEEFQKALQGRKIRVSAICAGFDGCLISENEDSRKTALTTIKEILTAAGALGSTGMIVVPAFNGQTKLDHKESRELLLKLLPEIGDHAQRNKTRLLLEPLNRGECHFLRQVADGAAICRDAKNPGICLMGDFWHMTWEETNDTAAFMAAGQYLHHVHIASRKTRNTPGEDDGDNYVAGFTGLKAIGYQDFISFECGCKGEPKAALTQAVKLIREQWAKA